ARVPVLLLNRRTENEAVSSVTGQNMSGARIIGSFLIAGGHTRFAYVAGLEDSSTSQEREQGFRRALAEAGTGLACRVVGHYDFAASREAARRLFAGPGRPDAVFCANDHTAFAVMQTASSEFGLQAGRDVSIVGFDDVSLAAWPAFELTTFSQPVRRMAERVVELALERIEEGESKPVHEVVSGELVVRKSARLPPPTWRPDRD
ncbi:MAG TPA: substrate-binding domain-containing protein, partial [Acetobacteraceae bacterium]|nr:substrate-binding domain-containing protein [Acetobacteraceae bacterium]